MIRVAPAAIVFGGPALAVIAISTAVARQHSVELAAVQPKRFSGSTVVQRMPSLLASSRLQRSIPVAIVRDEAAVTYYDSSADFDAIITRWHEALSAIGADVRVLSSIAARDDDRARVLIVPSSPCLTVTTRQAIDAATRRGAGVVLTGATGTYDGGCRPLGFGLIIGVTRAARAEVLEPREMTYVTFASAGPLSADIPPGARLDLNPGRQVALRDRVRDAFYTDYFLRPQPARNEELLDAALTHASRDGGRTVYWGFELSDVVRRPWDQAIARLLVRNSIAWAASEPLASIEPWPAGKIAAASIAQDVESGFTNARYAADSLRASGVRSTFYLTTSLAQRYERLSRRLAEFGEIGTHGETHRLLGGVAADEQRARLRTTQHDLQEIFGRAVTGLRPPEEQFDTTTMRAWLEAGGNYLFGANDSRSAAPELLRIAGDTLVLVGRVGSDDFAATARRVATTDSLAAIFLSEYERVRALGGHYVLSYHSQVLARPQLVPALSTIARRLAGDTAVWVATVGEVAEWWRARAALSVRARATGVRMQVLVRNASDQQVRDAVVDVVLPDWRRVVYADRPLLRDTANVVRLVVPLVPPQATETLTVILIGSP